MHRLLLSASAMLLLLSAGCSAGDGGLDAESDTPVAVSPGSTPTPLPTPTPISSSTPIATSESYWRPQVGDTWQLQLQGDANVGYNVKIYDIDLFDTPQFKIDTLHARGVRVVCYFSAGSSEEFREDYSNFLASDKGDKLDDWPGERWLDVRSVNVRFIMQKRLDVAVSKKCDGVDPDNVDGYANKNGMGLSADDQLNYNRFLATEAHRRGLAVGLKNDLDQIAVLVDSFDFQVNEQCHEFGECSKVLSFPSVGKPVLNVEYQKRFRDDASARAGLCATASRENIRSLVLPLKLDDGFRYSCD